MQTVLVVLQIVLAVFLIGLVLLQRSEDGALGGLGGESGNNGLISRRAAGNLLTKMTAFVAFCFAVTSLGLTILAKKAVEPQKSILDNLDKIEVNTQTEHTPEALPVKEEETKAEETKTSSETDKNTETKPEAPIEK